MLPPAGWTLRKHPETLDERGERRTHVGYTEKGARNRTHRWAGKARDRNRPLPVRLASTVPVPRGAYQERARRDGASDRAHRFDVGGGARREAGHRHSRRHLQPPAEEDLYLPGMPSAGYELRVREPEFDEHRMFQTPNRDIHVHFYPAESGEIEQYLLFRDFLRANPEACDRYAALKRELSNMDWADMNAYADAKTAFIEDIIRQVGTSTPPA